MYRDRSFPGEIFPWPPSLSLFLCSRRGAPTRVNGHANRRLDRCDDHGASPDLVSLRSPSITSRIAGPVQMDPRLRLDNPALIGYFVVRPGSLRGTLNPFSPASRHFNGPVQREFFPRFLFLPVAIRLAARENRVGRRESAGCFIYGRLFGRMKL